ncbi:MAG: hypothetical protein ABIA63_02810 [bacterium]
MAHTTWPESNRDFNNLRFIYKVYQDSVFYFEHTSKTMFIFDTIASFIDSFSVLQKSDTLIVGEYVIRGSLTGNNKNILAKDSIIIQVLPKDLGITFLPDKYDYKQNETADLSGMVYNFGNTPQTDVSYSILAGEDTILSNIISFLGTNATDSFYLSFTADTSLSIKGFINTVLLKQTAVNAVAPKLEIIASVPDKAGREAFNTSLTIKNTGKVQADISVDYHGEILPFIIDPGKEEFITRKYQTQADTQIQISITGDTNYVISKTVAFDEVIVTKLFPEPRYKEGFVSLDYALVNKGGFPSRGELDFTIYNGAGTIKIDTTYFVPVNTAGHDTLQNISVYGSVNVNLPRGAYFIKAQTPLSSDSAGFVVTAEDSVLLAGNTGTVDSIFMPLNTSISNHGLYNSIIKLSARLQDLMLDTTFTINVEDTIAWNTGFDVSTLQPGIDTIFVSAFKNGLIELQTIKIPVNIGKANFGIPDFPSRHVFMLGQTDSIGFTLQNTGDLFGVARFKLEILGETISDTLFELNAHSRRPVLLKFGIDPDIEEKTYMGYYYLNGDTTELLYTVDGGIDINVDVSLNKDYFLTGDTAVFELNIVDNDPISTKDLFVRVNYNGCDSTVYFDLDNTETIQINIPITEKSFSKIFYGIYHASGRGIYLNSHYIRVMDSLIAFVPDKEVYERGDNVQAAYFTQQSGTLFVSSDYYTDTIAVTGDGSFSFTLPDDILRGTVSLSYLFKGVSGLINIDVDGYFVRILDFRIDKASYDIAEQVNVTFQYESNTSMAGILEGYSGPVYGQGLVYNDSLFQIDSGIHNVSYSYIMTDSVLGPCRTEMTLRKRDSVPMFLAGAYEYFLAGDALIAALSLNRDDFPAGSENVSVAVTLYGSAQGAELQIILDTNVVSSQTVNLDGYTDFNVPIAVSEPGYYGIQAKVISQSKSQTKGLSLTYGGSLPDVTISSMYIINSQTDSSIISVTAQDAGFVKANLCDVKVYRGEPGQTSTLIYQNTVDFSAFGTVTLNFNYSSIPDTGYIPFYAVIDENNDIFEFNEQNNVLRDSLYMEPDTTSPVFVITGVEQGGVYDTETVVFIDIIEPNLDSFDILLNGQPFASGDTVKTNGPNTLALYALDKTGHGTDSVLTFTLDLVPLDTISPVITDKYIIHGEPRVLVLSAEPGVYRDTLEFSTDKFLLDKHHNVDTGGTLSDFIVTDYEVNNKYYTELSLYLPYTFITNGHYRTVAGLYEGEDGKSMKSRVEFDFGEVPQYNISGQGCSSTYYYWEDEEDDNDEDGKGKTALEIDSITSAGIYLKIVTCRKNINGSHRMDLKVIEPGHTVTRFTDSLLASRNILFKHVNELDGFTHDFRSGIYNVLLFLDNAGNYFKHLKSEKHCKNDAIGYDLTADEMAEAVYCGRLGIVNFKNKELLKMKEFCMQEVFGVRYDGHKYFKEADLITVEGPHTGTDTMHVSGDLLKVKITSGNVFGEVYDRLYYNKKKPGKEAGLIVNEYGRGKSVFHSFSLIKSLNSENINDLADLLIGGIYYAAPEIHDITAEGTLPVRIDIANPDTNASECMVTEDISSNAEIIIVNDELPGGDISGNTITWYFSLRRNKSISLKYILRMPGIEDTVHAMTILSELVESNYEEVDSNLLSIAIQKSLGGLMESIADSLNAITGLKSKDGKTRDKIIDILNEISNTIVNSREQAAYALSLAVECGRLIREIGSGDTEDIRRDIGRMIGAYEAVWRGF